MIRLLFLLVATSIFINLAFSQSIFSQNTVTLFELSNEAQKQISDEPEIIQQQTIQLNEAIYQENAISEGDQIILPLFSSESIEAEVTRVSTDVMGTTSITGKIPGEIPGHVIITYKGRRLFGTLHLFDQHRYFNIKSDSKLAEHYLVEKDIEAMEPFECGGAIIVSDDRESEIMNRYRREN
jgi:hypothetical protein